MLCIMDTLIELQRLKKKTTTKTTQFIYAGCVEALWCRHKAGDPSFMICIYHVAHGALLKTTSVTVF